MDKYALLDYKPNRGYFNIGDYVQSLAAKQYLPQVDMYLNREYLNKSSIESCKLIMNGWFMYKVNNQYNAYLETIGSIVDKDPKKLSKFYNN